VPQAQEVHALLPRLWVLLGGTSGKLKTGPMIPRYPILLKQLINRISVNTTFYFHLR
jgi:hypothetical protein